MLPEPVVVRSNVSSWSTTSWPSRDNWRSSSIPSAPISSAFWNESMEFSGYDPEAPRWPKQRKDASAYGKNKTAEGERKIWTQQVMKRVSSSMLHMFVMWQAARLSINAKLADPRDQQDFECLIPLKTRYIVFRWGVYFCMTSDLKLWDLLHKVHEKFREMVRGEWFYYYVSYHIFSKPTDFPESTMAFRRSYVHNLTLELLFAFPPPCFGCDEYSMTPFLSDKSNKRKSRTPIFKIIVSLSFDLHQIAIRSLCIRRERTKSCKWLF